MAKGSLYRAETRTGGIAGALKPVFDYFAQKQEEEKQKKYISNLLNAFNLAQSKMNEVASGYTDESINRQSQLKDVNVPLDVRNRGNVLQQNNMIPKVSQEDLEGMYQLGPMGIQPAKSPLVSQTLSPVIQKSGINPLTSKEKQYQSEDLKNQFVVDALTKGDQKYANPNLVNVLGNVLQSKAGRFQQKQVQQFAPGSDYGYFDDENNFHLVKPGVSTSNKTLYETENGKPKVYKLENGQKAYKKITTDFRGNKVSEDYEPLQFTPKYAGGGNGSGSGSGTDGPTDEKSYGKLLGILNAGNKKIKSIKNRFREVDGNYFPTMDLPYYKTTKVKDKESDQDIEVAKGYSKEQYQNIIEQEKSEYLDEAIQLMNEQGLDNAIQNIIEGVQKAGSITKAFDDFLKANPKIDKEDKRLLTDYVELLSL